MAETNYSIDELKIENLERNESASDEVAVRGQLRRIDRQYVETDASFSSRDRDAPGQNCKYIPPGNHNAEYYRLATYFKFPDDVPVKLTDLAASGFYYTGYKDRVKCFSCGMTVENWVFGDDGMDLRWHKTTCRMASGQEITNQPIPQPTFRSLFRQMRSATAPGLQIIPQSGNGQPMDITDVTSTMGRVKLHEPRYPPINFANILHPEHETILRSANLRSELERRKTFEKWPTYPAPFLVSDLAKEGFFYLGNLDRTQCFSCSGVLRNWAVGDSVSEQHSRHFQNCRIVRGEDAGNIPMSDDTRVQMDREHRAKVELLNKNSGEPPDPSPEQQRVLARYYPCSNPMNPHMISMERRLDTFDNRWPKRIRATPAQIAKAGFFFLGESDKTKCFYCNGGLQNWDPQDEPWTEHAKWFPECEFVLRKKGVEFVKRLVEAHPNINRPYIRNPASRDIPPDSPAEFSSNNQSYDNGEVQHNINIEEVEGMGFPRNKIDLAIRRRGNRRYENVEELLDDIFNLPEDAELNEGAREVINPALIRQPPVAAYAAVGIKREGASETGIDMKKTRRSSPPQSIESGMAESLRVMEEAMMCKQCKQNKSQITLLPCGHLCLCESCATDVKRCVICSGRVQDKIKIYRA